MLLRAQLFSEVERYAIVDPGVVSDEDSEAVVTFRDSLSHWEAVALFAYKVCMHLKQSEVW